MTSLCPLSQNTLFFYFSPSPMTWMTAKTTQFPLISLLFLWIKIIGNFSLWISHTFTFLLIREYFLVSVLYVQMTRVAVFEHWCRYYWTSWLLKQKLWHAEAMIWSPRHQWTNKWVEPILACWTEGLRSPMSPKEWSRQGKDFITVLIIACNFKLVDGSGIFCSIFISQRTVGTGFEKTKTTHRKELV